LRAPQGFKSITQVIVQSSEVIKMSTSGYLTSEYLANLTSPFNATNTFNGLTQSDLGQEVITNLWVNRNKTNPDFGQAEDTTWAVNTIPSDGVSEHSVAIGYALDGNPVYGPLGYTTTNGSDQLKVLRSSYVKRDWLKGRPAAVN
jgi:hypothetical protein